jgi:stage III sporulation protein SpoIIIAA
MNFIEGHKRANTILIHAQHRHGLSNTSCVNKEVIKKLKKIIKLYPNVKLM